MAEENRPEPKVKKTLDAEALKAEVSELKAKVAELKGEKKELVQKVDSLEAKVAELSSVPSTSVPTEDRIVSFDGVTYEVEGGLETVSSVWDKACKRFLEKDRTIVVLKRFGF